LSKLVVAYQSGMASATRNLPRIPDLTGNALFADLGCRSRQDIRTSLLTSSGLLLLFFTFENGCELNVSVIRRECGLRYDVMAHRGSVCTLGND